MPPRLDLPRRPIVGALAAVLTGLAVPLALIVLASLPVDAPAESDAYIRGIIGVLLMIPLLAALLTVHHALVAVAARALPVPMPVVAAVLSVIGSVAYSAVILATGAPLTWDRMGDLLGFAAVLWILVALGSTVQYFVSFRPR
jgi:hypothetical protein